jgi:KDO2-lipid IV(A) lauroyltransferase
MALVLKMFGAFCRMLPRRVNLDFGRRLGMWVYHLSGRRRDIALNNLKNAYGDEISEERKSELAKGSFVNFGTGLTEFFTFPSIDEEWLDEMMDISGAENLGTAAAEGNGVLFLSLHLGMWELIPVALISLGYSVSIVAKTARTASANNVLTELRGNTGITVLSGSGSMGGILRQLKSSGLVGFVLDQNALPKDGVFVPFFGRLACTLSSLAVIARRTGAPVVPVYTHRVGNRHKLVIEKPITTPDTPEREDDILNRTTAYSEWTEKAVRLHPEQWLWLHDRWRTRPPDDSDDLVPSSRFQVPGQEDNT